MRIEIDTNKKTLNLTKEVAEEVKNAMKKGNLTALQALERTQFFEDLTIQTLPSKKRVITEEESKINKMTFEEIKEAMKTKPEEDQKEFAKLLADLEKKTKAKGQTKKGGERKINPISLKTWYKKKYFKNK